MRYENCAPRLKPNFRCTVHSSRSIPHTSYLIPPLSYLIPHTSYLLLLAALRRMNSETPRVFIAATRQNDGKTTASLGLLSVLQKRYPRIGYIKPVGQRFVEIEEQKIDEDTVLMDRVFRLNCPLVD